MIAVVLVPVIDPTKPPVLGERWDLSGETDPVVKLLTISTDEDILPINPPIPALSFVLLGVIVIPSAEQLVTTHLPFGISRI